MRELSVINRGTLIMRVVQMLPTLAYGDAIGNNVIAIKNTLINSGYKTEIYAKNIDKRMKDPSVYPASKYCDDENNLIIYHLSTGDELNEKLLHYKAKVIIIYHNITPYEYFKGYDSKSLNLCKNGLEQAKLLHNRPIMCICVSEYNRECLIDMGYSCPIEVLPLIIKFDDYNKKPSDNILSKYKNESIKNILFVGRIVPNKKIENIILSFYLYNNYINSNSRLFIVGNYSPDDLYYKKLMHYINKLQAQNIYFTGHIPFNDVLAYYNLASLFLCLSEHEGFCVPLVEAMYFGKPIVAYNSTAVGETLGGSGILLNDNDPRVVAESMNLVLSNKALQKDIVDSERDRLKYFDNDTIKDKFMEIISKYI